MSKQIEIDELEPGFETDRLVADVIKVEYDQEYATGEVYGHQWVATMKKLYPAQGGSGGLRKNGEFCWSFSPSTVIADAFWAAEQISLFGSRPGHAAALYRHNTDGVFVIGQFSRTSDELYDLVTASTPAMVICLAILKLENASTK